MIPAFDMFILPMLRLFEDCNVRNVHDAIRECSVKMGLAEEDWQEMTRQGSRPKVVDRGYWSLTYLKQAGLLDLVKRSHYQITVSGLELLENPPSVITRDYLYQNFQPFREFFLRKRKKKDEVSHNDADSDAATNLFSEAESEIIELPDLEPVYHVDNSQFKTEDNMTLEEIYTLVDLNAKMGWQLTPEQEAQVKSLEEKYIKEKVLPLLEESIAPALAPIRRKMVLVMDYTPGMPLSVKLSRRVNFTGDNEECKIASEPVGGTKSTAGEHSGAEQGESKGESQGEYEVSSALTILRVTLPEGLVICEKKAKDTFIEVLQYLGIQRVADLGLMWCKIPLVSTEKDARYGKSQVFVDGYYINTNSGTEYKRKQLEEISRLLGEPLKVEVVAKG